MNKEYRQFYARLLYKINRKTVYTPQSEEMKMLFKTKEAIPMQFRAISYSQSNSNSPGKLARAPSVFKNEILQKISTKCIPSFRSIDCRVTTRSTTPDVNKSVMYSKLTTRAFFQIYHKSNKKPLILFHVKRKFTPFLSEIKGKKISIKCKSQPATYSQPSTPKHSK